MTTLPTGAQLVAAANVSEMQDLVSDQATAISEMPGGAVATTLTIVAGAVTPTVSCHLVDTEAAAASDDLTNIVTTNHTDGRRLLISMVDAARIVTVKHNAGGAGQIALANSYDLVLKVGGWVELKRTGANWEEIGRSQNLISAIQTSGAVDESYATVASHATTADIWGAKGNVINFTGTATVTAFPAAPQAGVRRRLICAGACSFTSAAGFVVDGGSYTAVAGDVVDVEAVSTSSFKLHPIPVGGTLSKTGNLAGLADASTARTNLGLAIGTDVQAYDAFTAKINVAQAFTKAQGCSSYAMTDGATITPDASQQNEGWVQLGGNRTLGVPSNLTVGKRQRFTWDILQDDTGSRTLAYAWIYSLAGGTVGTLSTTALSRDKLFGDVAYYNTSTITVTIATPGVVSWTDHGLRAGDKLQITTSGALPTGLTASTTYYVIYNDANSFWLATSLANAAAGTKIATSGSQSGTHTAVAGSIDLSLNKAFA